MQTKISADEAHSLRKTHGDALFKAAQTGPSSWNATTRSARFVMSTQGVDLMGDIVVTAGISTAQFERNPIAPLNHDSASWPIGRWANLNKVLTASPPRLEGDLVLAEAGGPIPEIDQAAWALSKGLMRASSIGFMPDWNAIEWVMDGDRWTGGLRFNQSTLLEASLVGVPANPDALAKGSAASPENELIAHVLATWSRSPEGRVMRRAEFDRIYQIGKRVKNGNFVGTRERIEALERVARNKRLAKQRAREIEMARLRG